MKFIKYLLLLGVWGFLFSSCVEDGAPEDAFAKAANLATFVRTSENLTIVATGDEFTIGIPVRITGPSIEGLPETITATVSVQTASTAEDGVHYKLGTKTVEFKKSENYIALFPVTVITEGIEPPLEAAPTIVMKFSAVSGAGNVIPSGKTVTVNLLYLCSSELAAVYDVTITRNDGNVYTYVDVIAKTGDGQYRGTTVGHWAPGSIGGTPGFDFIDVCDEISVPLQNLVNLYSNEVYGIGESYVKENGDMHIEYEITFAAGNRQYVADYVKR